MYEAMVINLGALVAVMCLSMVLMLKVKVPLLNIVFGLLLVIMAWNIGTLPGSPYIQLMATFFGLFTVVESLRSVNY